MNIEYGPASSDMRIDPHPSFAARPSSGGKLEPVRLVESIRPLFKEKVPLDRQDPPLLSDRLQEDTPQDLRIRRALHAYSNYRSGAESEVTLWYGVDIYV